MSAITEKIAELLIRRLQEGLSDQDEAILNAWRGESAENEIIFQQLTDADQVHELVADYGHYKKLIWEKIKVLEPSLANLDEAPVRSMGWRKYLVAASVLLVLSAAMFFWFRPAKKVDVVKVEDQSTRFKNDISPANQSAILQLSDGRKIFLDSLSNGFLSTEGKIAINKSDDGLSYKHKRGTSEVYFQALSTGKGKDYHLTLADGTQVWLDAMSSIHFPTSFPGSERIVTITGQCYFEVSKNIKQPFRVKVGNEIVEVLGTHFNIHAHEAEISTTLLEGSVMVKSETKGQKYEVVIQPGQQAVLTINQQLTINNDVDINEVIAWKNGLFSLKGATIEQVLKQLSRFYDIDIVFDGKISGDFVVKIPQNVEISKVLQVLELTGGVHFKIDGKKITVLP